MKRKGIGLNIAVIAVGLLLWTAYMILSYFNLVPQKSYTAEDFGIAALQSSVDFDGDGIDDYTDIMLGARIDAENHPRYDGSYFEGGYPPDDIGVCTDVVWRAFKNAGYDLKGMVDSDVLAHTDDYPAIDEPDPNIDFRRVRNLRIFFDKYAQQLTTDVNDIAQWQAGDIVIFNGNEHIGIVSDKRNKDGQPYIIHNGGQPNREEDYLKRAEEVSAHYRFDSSTLDGNFLIKW